MDNGKRTVEIPEGTNPGGKFKILAGQNQYWVGPIPENSKPGDKFTFNLKHLGRAVTKKRNYLWVIV